MSDLMLKEAVSHTESLAGRRDDIFDANPEDQKDWLLAVGDTLRGWDYAIDYSTMAQAKLLYSVWTVWENESPSQRLHPDATFIWDNDFYKWAKMFTRKRSIEPANITIWNKITVYRDWIAENIIACPDVVYLPVRSENGEIANPKLDKEEDWESVEFNPLDVDYGKLLTVRKTARTGMGCEIWTALADPHVTVEEMKSVIREEKTDGGTDKESDDFRLFESEGILYASDGNGVVEGIAMLLLDNNSPLFRRGVLYLMKAAGIRDVALPEREEEKVLPLAKKVNGGVVISKNGTRLGMFDIDEVETIRDVLDSFLGE